MFTVEEECVLLYARLANELAWPLRMGLRGFRDAASRGDESCRQIELNWIAG
jgi:hypothetical protein